MSRKNFYIVVVLAMLAALVTIACHADCSPGFWKNHTELWWDDYGEKIYQGDKYTGPLPFLEALQGGKNTRISRFWVSNFLNGAYPDAPCND